MAARVVLKKARKWAPGLAIGAIIITGAVVTQTGFSLRSLFARESTDGEIEIRVKPMTFWVESAGSLRAASVQEFGGPPPVNDVWQFQIVNLAPEGKAVKKGDPLIMFDGQKLSEDLQRFLSQLDQASKELEKTKVEIDLEEQSLLSRLAAAENRFEKEKLKQGTSRLIETEANIDLDKLSLEQARRETELLKQAVDWHRKSSEATYQIIASKKSRAQNKVDEIQRGMSRFVARADRDGVLVYKSKWNGERYQVGESVWSGLPLIEIPDLRTIQAEALVAEADIGKVRIGQRAEIAIDAFPGKTFSGRVTSVGRLVRQKSWDIPKKVLDVQVALDSLDVAIMRPNMSIQVRLEIETLPECIVIPLKAVLLTAEGARVKVKTPTGWQEHPVTLGGASGTETVVLDGLKAGDRIAGNFLRTI